MITFYEYLAELEETGAAAERDDPAGDFAIDAEADSFFPRSITADPEGFAKALNYIYFNRRACSDVLDAFMECWQEYYKDVTGEDWIEPGYNGRWII